VGPYARRCDGDLGASNSPAPFRNCTEALDTASHRIRSFPYNRIYQFARDSPHFRSANTSEIGPPYQYASYTLFLAMTSENTYETCVSAKFCLHRARLGSMPVSTDQLLSRPECIAPWFCWGPLRSPSRLSRQLGVSYLCRTLPPPTPFHARMARSRYHNDSAGLMRGIFLKSFFLETPCTLASTLTPGWIGLTGHQKHDARASLTLAESKS
jgi:hypothetical protein